MTTREQLHERIDALPEELLPEVESFLAGLPEASAERDDEAFYTALRKVAGSFRAEDYPHWATDEDVDRWIRHERTEFDERSARLWGESPVANELEA